MTRAVAIITLAQFLILVITLAAYATGMLQSHLLGINAVDLFWWQAVALLGTIGLVAYQHREAL